MPEFSSPMNHSLIKVLKVSIAGRLSQGFSALRDKIRNHDFVSFDRNEKIVYSIGLLAVLGTVIYSTPEIYHRYFNHAQKQGIPTPQTQTLDQNPASRFLAVRIAK